MAKKPEKKAEKKVAKTNVLLHKDGNARIFYPGDEIPEGWVE